MLLAALVEAASLARPEELKELTESLLLSLVDIVWVCGAVS